MNATENYTFSPQQNRTSASKMFSNTGRNQNLPVKATLATLGRNSDATFDAVDAAVSTPRQANQLRSSFNVMGG